MEPLDFLSAVLPSAGRYCATILEPKNNRQFFVDTLPALATQVSLQDTVGHNTYMAMASFGSEDKRTAVNAMYMRSIFVDIDCGVGSNGQAKAYPTKRAAVEALDSFCKTTGLEQLGAPWIVDSGGGVHVYWPLDKDAPVAAWKVVAEEFKKAAYAVQFKIDMGVTADAARVLRLPGTHNRKYTPERIATLRNVGTTFSLTDIAARVCPTTAAVTTYAMPGKPPSLILPGRPPQKKAPMSATALALASNSVTHFKKILIRTLAGTGCEQLKHYHAHAQEDGVEPLWRALLSIAKPCEDGMHAAARLSSWHPYSESRMLTKMAQIKGPYPCTAIASLNPGVCEGCAHWGKITNPLALGRDANTTTMESVVEVRENELTKVISRPAPPKGFSFGRNQVGGVYHIVETVDDEPPDEKIILPFDFFLVDVLVEDRVYTARFLSIKEDNKRTVAIPMKVAANRDATLAELAKQSVMSAVGSGNDKNLYEYVRACISDASAWQKELLVPPNYGWQADNSFAVNDRVLKADGTSYTFVSEKLSNIVNASRPHGDLYNWKRVSHMLMRKNLWGQMAVLALSFGSALKRFTPANSRAFTFHIASSTSGVGKTLALSLGNSVWGHPTNFSVKPSTSERTMLQRAGMLGSLPLNIDEVTNKVRADGDWLPSHIFDFSQGGHKLKGQGAANAEMRDDLKWEANSILTSNAPIMEAMMGARDTTSNGEAYRLLEWRAHTRLEWSPDERETLSLLDSNYGHAGAAWGEWLVMNQDRAQAVVADAMQQWRELLFSPDEERFWTAGCASVLAAIKLLGPKFANIIEIPEEPVVAFLSGLVREARRIINTNKLYAMDLLSAYIRENHGGFIKLSDPGQQYAVFSDGRTVSKDSTRGAIRGRIETNISPGWTDFFVDIRLLKEFCARRNKSYLEFLQELRTQAVVQEVTKNLLAKTGGPSYTVKCLKISKTSDDDV